MERRRLSGVTTRSVKQNINFLDRATYLPFRLRKDSKISKYDDGNGYTISWSPDYGPPTAWDSGVLKVLLFKAHQTRQRKVVIPKFVDFMRDLNLSGTTLRGTNAYREKVYSALRRYSHTTFEFEKNYDKGVDRRMFGPFSDVKFHYKKGSTFGCDFEVEFSEGYLEACEASFCIFQNLEKFLQLTHTPIAARLYDILITKIYGINYQGQFPIGLDNLFVKLGLKDIKYDSEKLRKLKKGMSEVQKVLDIDYDVTGTKDKKVLFYFSKPSQYT